MTASKVCVTVSDEKSEKPGEERISPYLQQPLRSFEQDRKRSPRQTVADEKVP
jgi:hypothetical protein